MHFPFRDVGCFWGFPSAMEWRAFGIRVRKLASALDSPSISSPLPALCALKVLAKTPMDALCLAVAVSSALAGEPHRTRLSHFNVTFVVECRIIRQSPTRALCCLQDCSSAKSVGTPNRRLLSSSAGSIHREPSPRKAGGTPNWQVESRCIKPRSTWAAQSGRVSRQLMQSNPIPARLSPVGG